jgi:hypothetical protein
MSLIALQDLLQRKLKVEEEKMKTADETYRTQVTKLKEKLHSIEGK